ncbi:MAG: type VI secretion protein IcmF/TssM N-terminal domain-containing protein [Pirellulales bacterium]
MSDAPAAEKPTLLKRLHSLLPSSPAALAAWAVSGTLLSAALATWLVYRQDPKRLAWGDYMDWTQGLCLIALVVGVSVVTYWSVRIWCLDYPSEDEELERAWQSGMKMLSQRGVRLDSLPVVLVLGCDGANMQRALIDATGKRRLCETVPAAEAPVRWHLLEDVIVLCCGDIGCFTAIQKRLPIIANASSQITSTVAVTAQTRSETYAALESIDDVNGSAYASTIGSSSIHSSMSNSMGSSSSMQTNHITARVNRSVFRESSAAVATPPVRSPMGVKSSAPNAEVDIVGRVDERLQTAHRLLNDLERIGNSSDPLGIEPDQFEDWQPDSLSSTEQVRQTRLLDDLGRRLKAARRGAAPLNGILVRVATRDLANATSRAGECGRGLRSDLNHLQNTLGLQAPTILMCDQLQADAGFAELIRRVGPQAAEAGVIGRHISVRKPLTSAGASHAAEAALTDLKLAVTDQLRMRRAVLQPTNHRLFQLLLRCRGPLAAALKRFLIETLSEDDSDRAPHEALPAAGIYFSSLGNVEGHGPDATRAFARGVWQRLEAQQELLRWTDAERRSERARLICVRAMQLLCAALLTAAALQLMRVL